MQYKPLGRTGVLVSDLCFGTMTFGREADESESAAMFRECREAGINLFDCSNNYSDGLAETILGKLIADCRDEVLITTKVSSPTGKDVNAMGSSRRNIMLAVEKSLSRLKTDRIDIYILHRFDPFTPVEETMRALDNLVRQGKVVYLGASNWAAWQIAKALGISEMLGIPRFECIQPMYNLIKRQAEVEILPMAESEQLGVIAFNPLAGGLLTGKYSNGVMPRVGRIVEKESYSKRYGGPLNQEMAARFVEYAEKIGVSPVTLAVAWVKSNPGITAPILGARSVAQLKDSLAAAEFKMEPHIREAISKISIDPGSATDRSEEQIDTKFKLRH